MYNLLNELNETAEQNISTELLIENNLNFLCEYDDIDKQLLNETVTSWVNQKKNQIQAGDLPPEELENTILIMGGLNAIQNMDIAQAFNTKGDLGRTLFKVYGKDETQSNLALNRIKQIGSHPSSKSFTQQAKDAIEVPNKISNFSNSIQLNIERVMNKLLASEKAKDNQNPNPNGPAPAGGPSPEQKPTNDGDNTHTIPKKEPNNSDIKDWFV